MRRRRLIPNRPIQVIGSILRRSVGLLHANALILQSALHHVGDQNIADHQFQHRTTDQHFPRIRINGPKNTPCSDFRLKYRRGGLRFAVHPVARPVKLRRVHRRQLHHRQCNRATGPPDFNAQGLCEAFDRMFRSAIGRLVRNGDIGKAGPDIDDITTRHDAQRSAAAVYRTKIRGISDLAELCLVDLVEGREAREHGGIDPDFRHPQFRHDPVCGLIQHCAVRYIDSLGPDAVAQFGRHFIQTFLPSRQNRDAVSPVQKSIYCRAAHTGGPSGDHGDGMMGWGH